MCVSVRATERQKRITTKSEKQMEEAIIRFPDRCTVLCTLTRLLLFFGFLVTHFPSSCIITLPSDPEIPVQLPVHSLLCSLALHLCFSLLPSDPRLTACS